MHFAPLGTNSHGLDFMLENVLHLRRITFLLLVLPTCYPDGPMG